MFGYPEHSRKAEEYFKFFFFFGWATIWAMDGPKFDGV